MQIGSVGDALRRQAHSNLINLNGVNHAAPAPIPESANRFAIPNERRVEMAQALTVSMTMPTPDGIYSVGSVSSKAGPKGITQISAISFNLWGF